MKHTEAQARWKNNPVTLFMVRHEAHISFGQPKNERAKQRQGEREIKRGKGGEEGGVCAFALSTLPPLSIFVSSFCACSTHTLTVQWISNFALISCAPDETNTDSLFTFVKAPAAAVLVPHTLCMHTNTHSHTHSHNLWIRGLAPAGAYRKSRLCTKWPWLHSAMLSCYSRTHSQTRTHTVCHVSLDRTTLPHISACYYLGHYTAPTLNHWLKKAPTNYKTKPKKCFFFCII